MGRRAVHRFRRATALLILAPLLSAGAGCLNGAFYVPTPVRYQDPEEGGRHPAEEVFFRSGDGTRLQGYIFPAAGKSLGVVIYFHGNYGNLTHYLDQFRWLSGAGFTLFAFNYRGYGGSRGSPSRKGVHRDGLAALDYVRTHPLLGGQDRFVFGQSLGGAVAVAAVAETEKRGIRAVVLEGVFDSYRVEARQMIVHTVTEKWGAVPCLGFQAAVFSRLFVSDALRPGERIGDLSPIPVLLIHCAGDRTVLSSHSRRLYKRANAPKTLWIVEGCDHLAIFTPAAAVTGYRGKLIRFLMRHRSEKAGDTAGRRINGGSAMNGTR
jgi:hypothetical protein